MLYKTLLNIFQNNKIKTMVNIVATSLIIILIIFAIICAESQEIDFVYANF